MYPDLMSNGFVRNLADLRPEEHIDAGGKAHSLGKMLHMGLPVPPGYVLLATAYDAFLDYHDLRSDYERLTGLLQTGSADAGPLASELAAQFDRLPLPEPVATELSEIVELLSGEQVAVRSSATVEDGDRAAWAGQLQTFMNVPAADISAAVRKAWASLFSARATAYAQHRHISLNDARVAVILQQNIDAAVSGVVFTADPVSQNETHLVLEAVFGLGDTLVSGTATPDTYWIDKATLSVVRHRAITQQQRLTLKPRGGTQIESIDIAAGSRPKLTSDDIGALTRMAISAESAWDGPIDIEWCKDQNGALFLLQARPITTLSSSGSGITSARPHSLFTKSITRGWSLLFCQIWHRAYTHEFYSQFGWGLSDVFYEGTDGLVNVYRAPMEFVTGMTELVTKNIDEDPDWLEEQAKQVIQLADAARAWLATVTRTPLSQYTPDQLGAILDEFITQNIQLGPRYVLVLWYPIQMEKHPERARYAAAIDAAIHARIETHSVGGAADEFARQFASEVLRRAGKSEELSRATPLESLRAWLAGESDLHEDRLHAYNRQFLVTRDGVLHEDAYTYCSRKGIPIQFTDESLGDDDFARGVPAFPGKVRGTAQIVRGPEDFAKFADGNVLVTSMTTPNFEEVMSRAAGIVTDEGGVTSHAAILARELRKPTITGTQVATRLFASGDLAEVNADDGIAQKLPLGDAVPLSVTKSEKAAPRTVLIVEDSIRTRQLLVAEFYRQANDAPLSVIEEWSRESVLDSAVNSFRRLRDLKRTVNAVVVDLKLEGNPLGGTELVEQIREEGYPADQICVYSAMATSASAFDADTRQEVFGRLEKVGVSRKHGNVFGKVRPGEEMVRDSLKDEAGELATIQELVTTVLTKIGVPPTINAASTLDGA
jgi:pyruvate, water dikinase